VETQGDGGRRIETQPANVSSFKPKKQPKTKTTKMAEKTKE
jgi:hypothetical protein